MDLEYHQARDRSSTVCRGGRLDHWVSECRKKQEGMRVGGWRVYLPACYPQLGRTGLCRQAVIRIEISCSEDGDR